MPLDEIIRRQNDKKARGESQYYPEHAGNAPKAPGGARAVALPLLRPACAHEGRVIAPCHSCGSEHRHVRDCATHGTCTRIDAGKDVDRVCATCPDYRAVGEPVPVATFPGHLNGSLVEHAGRLLLASRIGWTGARIGLTPIGDDLAPAGPTTVLRLDHHRAAAGQEDPRLVAVAGRLHVAFCGVEVGAKGDPVRTSQLVAELGDDLRPVRVWAPEYAGRRWPMEKNWAPFELGGALHSVYSVEPHAVLRHEGGAAGMVAETPSNLAWAFGHLRGGAAPVRVGGEFYHWFHGTQLAGGPTYVGGLYTFAAEPPFAVRRWVPAPLLSPPEKPNREGKRVAFPCGAVLRGDKWLVSAGWDDAETRVFRFDAAEIEARLVRAQP